MKQFRKLFLLIISIIIAVSTIVFAHPGRTDSNGGHWDRSTGTYHFHTGEYAGRNSSGSSNSEHIPFFPPYEPSEKINVFEDEHEEEYEYKDETKDDGSFIIPLIFVLLFYFSPFIVSIFMVICDFIREHLPKHNLGEYEKVLNAVSSIKQEVSELQALTKASPVQIPEGFEIGSDNLPKEKGSASWGKTFTLYTSYNGKKLHSKYRCNNAVLRKHVYKLGRIHNENLCKICAWGYNVPDLSWYDAYLKQQSSNETLKNKQRNLQSFFEELTKYYKKCNKGFLKFLIQLSRKNTQKLNELNSERKKQLKKYTNNNS